MDFTEEISKIQDEVDSLEKAGKLNQLSYNIRYIFPDQSYELAEEAKKIAKNFKDKETEAISKMNMAFAKFLMSGDFPILKYLTEAYDVLIKTHKMPELPVLLNYLGNVYESYGEFQKALEFGQEALKLAGDNDLKETEADAHSTVGMIFSRLSDNSSAIKNFQKSLTIREEIDNKPAMASSLNLIARTYALDNMYEKSEEFYKKAIELRIEIDDTGALPWSFIGMASLFEKQKKFDEAIGYYLRSLKMNKLSGDKRCRLHCSFGLARIYFENNNLEDTINYLNEALEIANELNAKPIQFEVHHLLADYYEKTGDVEKAYNHFKLFQKIKEEVLSTQLHNKLKNQQMSFEVEKSQKEAEIFHLRNVELKKAFDEIAKKNGEILDSITYAKNIQNAVMLPPTYLKNSLNDYFILFMPRDIVSGDFYWSLETDNKIYIAAADCTGHGVPGAFMSMLGLTFINEIVQNNLNATAADILNNLRSRIIAALRQNDDVSSSKDGMDIALCILHKFENLIEFSGAYNPLYIVENDELTEIKANRMPIGHHPLMDQNFENHRIETRKGMCFYMFSDGYSDQFGGEEGKKFMSKNMKRLVVQINKKPMVDQKNIMERTMKAWKKEYSQTDDILVIGFRI